jgi:glycosyltransferase involved in cell wall biosynthesis
MRIETVSRLRILLINDGASPHTGGMNRMVVETCSGLMRAGHEVAIAYHDTHPATVDCRVFHVPEAHPMADRKLALDRALTEFRPDVIHNHSTKILPLLPALSEQFPLATFCHDQSLFCSGGDRVLRGWKPCHRPHGLGCLAWHYLAGCGGKDPRNNWKLWRSIPDRMMAWRLPRSRMQVASKFMRAGLLENRYPADRIDLVPLFAEPPAEETATFDARLLLVPARLVRSKGVDLAVQAFAQLGDLEARLVVAGAGPEREPLERLSRQLGVADRVQFTGELSPRALAAWYSRSGMVLFPVLRPEPFGLVGVEALAHGKPIVAVAGGAVDEWLWPGETGLRVEERTPVAFAAAVRELLISPERCAAMGQAAKARYAYFHPTAYVERLMAAFERTVRWHRDTAR